MASLTNKYLNLTGLQTFWGKVKAYVDGQDAKLWTAAKAKIDADDTAVRSYIESLKVNGVEVKSNKSADAEGTSLSVTIGAEDIAVAYGDTTSDVQSAISDINTRLTTEEGKAVVSSLTVSAEHANDKVYVGVSQENATGDVKITVDDTAIDEKFGKIDEEIAEIKASAGVTNIGVFDVNSASTDENFVDIKLEATVDGTLSKPNDWTGTNEEWEAYAKKFGRGDIKITLDESKLDEKIIAIENEIANNEEVCAEALTDLDTRLKRVVQDITTLEGSIEAEVADRKEDITKLAGTGYTAANGDTLGSWSGVTYNNITDLSAAAVSETANRKSDIAGLAGDEWDETNHAWKTTDAPTYKTITTLSGAVVAAEEKIEGVEAKITALASATHFRGVLTKIPETAEELAETLKDLDYGDIIIVGNKEYIYNADPSASDYTYSKSHWVELGDTTAEMQRLDAVEGRLDTAEGRLNTAEERLDAVEGWIDQNIITESDINGLSWTTDVPTFS